VLLPSTASAASSSPESTPAGDVTPAALRCLSRYYGGRVVRRGDSFVLELGSGKVVPYDDGREKSFDERLESPDLEDMFTPRYHRGALAPVTDLNFDPGRARPALLFEATYGATAEAVEHELVVVKLVSSRISVHRRAAESLRRVSSRLSAFVGQHPEWAALFSPLGGGFNFRNVAGTEQRSAHAYGVAIDLNPKFGAYWRWQKTWENRIPSEVVEAFESEGFIWGGRWFHFDTMHFEYRPELLDESCYEDGVKAEEREGEP
jgi:hypothetical protein